jgi:hypothetical protein
MPESQTLEEGATPEASESTQDPQELPLEDAGKKALVAEREARREADKRVEHLEAELNKLQRKSMTEQEKAIAEAVDAARSETAKQYGSRLAAAEIKAAAAGRFTDDQIVALVKRTDLAGFLTPDGEVNEAEVAAYVDSIAPAKDEDPFPDLGQGPRGTQPHALNGDPLLRDLKSKLGIR